MSESIKSGSLLKSGSLKKKKLGKSNAGLLLSRKRKKTMANLKPPPSISMKESKPQLK